MAIGINNIADVKSMSERKFLNQWQANFHYIEPERKEMSERKRFNLLYGTFPASTDYDADDDGHTERAGRVAERMPMASCWHCGRSIQSLPGDGGGNVLVAHDTQSGRFCPASCTLVSIDAGGATCR